MTVLFADLVGHTEILTRVDPEEWQALLRAYFAEMAQRVQRYGGTVEKFIGDAIFAVFGVPRAHEDDPERALRAAIEMQEELSRLNLVFQRRLGTSLGLRIAVATGEVVTPGEGQLVTGDLAALAERLQKEAPPNRVILSERAYRLTAPLVEVEPLGPLTLKGFSEGQAAFLVRRLQPGILTRRAVEMGAPLIGRDREMETLLDTLDRVRAGRGQVLGIIGDAGLGKSRLVAELRNRLGAGIKCVEARCHEFQQATAYGLIVQHLRLYLELREDDLPEVGRVQLGAALYRLFASPPPDIAQALEYLLGFDTPHGSFEASIRGHGPEGIRSRVNHAIVAFWEAVAAKGPLLLVVEDLHWIDSASAGVLGEMLPVTERVPLMLQCTFRPERRSLAWEFRETADRDFPHRYREVRVEPLSAKDTEELARLLLERAGMSTQLTRSVAQRAEGNPFYVEEVVRSLQQHTGPAPAVGRLPDTLHGVLLARLDSLPAGTRRVLQTASVIGRTFPLGLLAAASGSNGELSSHLSILQRTQFLLEQQRLPVPQFAFKHVLLLEAAYQTLLRDERRELHRRVAEALEREVPAPRDLPILVRHFVQAEEWGKAFAYAVKAAEIAQSLSALDSALEHYDIAVGIARDHPESVSDPAMLFRAQRGRGDCLAFLGRIDEAERHFEALLTLYRTPELRAQLYQSIGRLHLGFGNLRKAQTNLEKALRLLKKGRDPAREVEMYRNLAHILERRRDYPAARKYAALALTMARKHTLRAQIPEIYRVLSVTHWYGGDLRQAVAFAREALTLTLQDNDGYRIVHARNQLAHVLLFTGSLREAQQEGKAALALATDLGIVFPRVLVQLTLEQILLEQGRWEDAAEILKSAEDIVRRHALGIGWEARVCREQGFVALAHGAWEEAIRHLEAAKTLAEQAGNARDLPKIHQGFAEAYLGLRSLGPARAHALRVLSHERGGTAFHTPSALRILAEIARERGHHREALAFLHKARTLLESRTGSGDYGRVLFEIAKTQGMVGRDRAAQEAAGQSLEVFRALEAVPFIEAAERMIAQIVSRGGERHEETSREERRARGSTRSKERTGVYQRARHHGRDDAPGRRRRRG